MSVTKHTMLYVLAVIISIYIFQVNYYWHYINDDAYITFRYSCNLADGLGPYFNPGEHVEGYSNLTWMVLMAAVAEAFGYAAVPLAAKIIGAFFGLLTVVATWYLCKEALFSCRADVVRASVWGCCAAGVVAVSPGFVLNCLSGLETSFFSFLLVMSAILISFECRQMVWRGSGIACALLVLTRPEGVLFFAVPAGVVIFFTFLSAIKETGEKHGSWAAKVITSPVIRILCINGTIVIITLCCHIVLRYFVYDAEILPNTYYAKTGGFWKTTPFSYVYSGLLMPAGGIAGAGACLLGFAIKRRIGIHITVAASYVLSACMLVFIAGTGWMPGERLVVPALPEAAIITVTGWFFLVGANSRITTRADFVIISIILVLLWLYTDTRRTYFYNETCLRAHGYRTGHAALARWLNDHAQPGDTAALMDIGLVGFYCRDLRIIDITGLTDRHIAKSSGGFLNKAYDVLYVLKQRPQFIVLTILTKGVPYTRPPPDAVFSFWTLIEKKYYEHPLFQKHYVKKRPVETGENSWLKILACSNGAETIFEHAHVKGHYLLAVFESDDRP